MIIQNFAGGGMVPRSSKNLLPPRPQNLVQRYNVLGKEQKGERQMKKACILLTVLVLILGFVIAYTNTRSFKVANAPPVKSSDHDYVPEMVEDLNEWSANVGIYIIGFTDFAQHRNICILAGVGAENYFDRTLVRWVALYVYNRGRWHLLDVYWQELNDQLIYPPPDGDQGTSL